MRSEGFSALELVVSLALSSLLVAAAASFLLEQSVAVRRVMTVVERIETSRIVFGVLRAELHAGVAGRDWAVHGDSVRLRAFRATVLPCEDAGEGQAVDRVWVRGARRPEPRKDSVLILADDGIWRVAAFADVHEAWESEQAGDSSCPGTASAAGPWIQRWNRSWAPVGARLIAARVFERGSYHLADGAFRYRTGRGGRQPITPQVLEAGSSLGGSASSRLAIRLRFSPASTSAVHDSAHSSIWPSEP